MSVLLILAIVLPIVGAVGVLVVSRVPAAKPSAGYLALGSVALTTIFAIVLMVVAPELTIPLARNESLVLGSPLSLRHEPIVGSLAFALALATLAALLTQLSRSQELRAPLTASILGLLAAGLLSLWAGDPLTLVAGWAICDVILCAGQLAGGVSPAGAVRTLVFGGVATILLWSGVLLCPVAVEGDQWHALAAGGIGTLAILASGMMRLWAYPAHLGAPDELEAGAALAAPLFLVPAIGWGLWLHVAAASGGAVPGASWAGLLGAAALAVGGFLAWARSQPGRTLAELAMAAAGSVLLASSLAGDRGAAVLASGATAWVLGVTVLALGEGFGKKAAWWSIPSAAASASLLGAPLTLGFVAGAHLMRQAAVQGHLVETLALFAGNLFLVPALVRWWRERRPSATKPQRWAAVARGLGLGLPAALVVVAGLYPPLLTSAEPTALGLPGLLSLPGWPGWLLWVTSLAAGAAIAWQDSTLRARMELLLGAMRDLLRLEWLYEGAVGTLTRGLEALQRAEDLATGAGALLWPTLLLLVMALVWSR